ncbi:MAG: type II toxin-antitoxin system HicB family antitoxin [Planctomycetes bacterium]|nr:type II toxin-antitoxin system HicB family antitoxin [Planctomycetota bacterium]
MEKVRFIFWQDEDAWLGHLEEYPDYITQGETLEDLKAHLLDLHKDLSGGHIPCARRVAELDLS